MAYLSLYRKYRPRFFSEIDGQRHVAQTLQNALRAGRTTHAYLFAGPRGTGKTTTARVLAAALNCEKERAAEPCGECRFCTSIRDGHCLDVIEIDGASNRRIEEMRTLREGVQLRPAECRYKVYIIDEVHMLTPPAFNALLKTLEEPPAHVVFMMATTEPHRLPPTILSRCQRFDFRRLPTDEIEGRLAEVAKAEGIPVQKESLRVLARMADGSMRDALSLLEQVAAYAEQAVKPDDIYAITGSMDPETPLELARAMVEKDLAGLLERLDRAVAEGRDLRHLAAVWREHVRHMLLLQVCRDARQMIPLPEQAIERLESLSGRANRQELFATLDILGEADRELRWSTQPRLVLEMAAVRLCAPTRQEAPAEEPAAARPPTRELRKETAEEAPFEPGEMTTQSICKSWGHILDRLKKKRETAISAFLREGTPVELKEDVLVVEFNHEFHRDQMNAGDRKSALAAVLKELWGADVRIECRLAEKKTKQAPTLKNAMNVFPGSEVVEKE